MNLKSDKLVSNTAFNCNLRHYTLEAFVTLAENGVEVDAEDVRALTAQMTRMAGLMLVRELTVALVGRCRLTPGFCSRRHACFQLLKLKCDQLLSNFAFNFNMRPAALDAFEKLAKRGVDVDAEDVRAVTAAQTSRVVGRCRLTPA